jgi:outer membrane protein assembly factor BamB
LQRWFVPVEGQGGRVSQRDYHGVQCGVLDGLLRLRSPWTDRTSLRWSLAEHQNLRIYLWNGEQGVALYYYEYAHRAWAAYRTTRQVGQPRPRTYALVATDEDRHWRTNPQPPATFELRHAGGELVLCRGDVHVLRVGLAQPPTEVLVEGHAVFRQLQLVPAAPLPDDPPLPLADAGRPADLPWMGELSTGATFAKHGDGSVELVAEKNQAPAWVATRAPRDTLHEVILQLDNPQPGTGFFLAGDDGRPTLQVNFFRERRTGLVSLAPIGFGDGRQDSDHDLNQQPTCYLPERPWLRLLFGCGVFKWWVSDDGVHWGRAWDPLTNQRGPIRAVGLYCTQGDQRRTIRLQRLLVRELEALNALAPAELLRLAPALPLASDLGDWLETVLMAQPDAADTAAWRRAAAIRTLAAGAPHELASPLLEHLVADGLAAQKTWDARRAILDEALRLAATWDDAGAAARWLTWYEQRAAGEPRGAEAFARLSRAQMVAPLWCRHAFAIHSEDAEVAELLHLAYAGDWEALARLARRQRFWRRWQQGQPPTLLEWGAALAARGLPRGTAAEVPLAAADWRHPLQVDLSKEGFNTLAELQAALDGQAYADACQIITSASGPQLLGLLPDAQDPRLLLSLPGVLALAMREHPPLQAVMAEQFAPRGRLRVRQAIAQADEAAVAAGSIQFFGTAAAAEAHRWLGDRALSGGELTLALGHYRQARGSAPAELLPALAAAEQLAAALLGRSAAEPVSGEVRFGDARFSGEEFARLLAEVRQARQASAAAIDAAAARPRSVAAGGFAAQTRIRLDGDAGENPQNVPGEYQHFNLDWAARQWSALAVDERIYFSNRFQVSCWNAGSGQWDWRNGLGGEQAPAHEWRLVPMRPVVAGDRLFVRRLQRPGPQLACLERSTGKLLWTTRGEGERLVVSDPLVVQDEVLAVVAARSEQELAFFWTRFDGQTGARTSERLLMRLRDTWWQQRSCQLTPLGERALIVAGGSALLVDLSGQVLWLRQVAWLPPQLDPFWHAQDQQPAVVQNNRLFVAQPGVRCVECLDLESGRLHWRKVLVSLRRVLGAVDDRLLVETSDGLLALNMADGQVQWAYPADDLLDAHLAGGPGGLLITRGIQLANANERVPTFVWLNPETGAESARFSWPEWKHERPKVGPFVAVGPRLFVLAGRGIQDPHRDLVELVPTGPAGPPVLPPTIVDRWTRHADSAQRQWARRILPEWTLLDAQAHPQAGHEPQWQGETDLLLTAAAPGRPVRLARRLEIPATGAPKLRLKVANLNQGQWKLDVVALGRTWHEQQVDPQWTGGNWKEIEVDLRPLAGRTAWVILRQHEVGGPDPLARWKRLEPAY